jgi:L-glyceraldehyde 3-phosphate reductase
VRQGKALYIGISNWPLEQLRIGEQYLREHNVPLLIYQGRLNLIDRKPMDSGILQFCRESGVGFIAFSPLAQGLLTDRYLNGIPSDSRMAREHFLKSDRLSPELLAYVQQLRTDAKSKGQTTSEAALRWVLAQEGVTSVLIGASSVEQLAQNLKCIDNL